MTLQALLLHLRGMKHYIIAAACTFLAGVYLGYSESDQFLMILHGQLDRLKELTEQFGASEHQQLRMLGFIFFNNIMVTLLMVYGGAFFGIMPLFTMLTNGMMIGYLAERSVTEVGLGHFLLAVLPHGIIEIPAVILASAYGIRFGILVAKSVIFLPLPSKRSKNGTEFVQFLKISVPLIILLCGSLIVAAIIESMVTYPLVRP